MPGGIGPDIHSITGLAMIVLMVVHAVWATAVLLLRMISGINLIPKALKGNNSLRFTF